jgi:hypothetical protein
MTEIGGAMLTIEDIINVNKATEPFEVENFFILMEVYGETPEVPTFINKLYEHKTQRTIAKDKVEAFLVVLQKSID